MLHTNVNSLESYRAVPEVLENVAAVKRLPITTPNGLDVLMGRSLVGKPKLANILELEEQVLGVSPIEDPEGFFVEHTEYLWAADERLASMYPTVRDRVITSLADYVGEDSIDAAELSQEFTDRLAGVTGVYAADPFLARDAGIFGSLTRSIEINALVLMGLDAGVITEAMVTDTLLAHEIIHGLLSSAQTKGLMHNWASNVKFDLNSRQGFETIHTATDETISDPKLLQHSHTWFMESGIEDARQKALSTETSGYRVGVAVQRTLKHLYPVLRPAINDVMFRGMPPAHAVGMIEGPLGPLGLEEIGKVFDDERKSIDRDAVKAKVLERLLISLPEDKRDQAREVFKSYTAETDEDVLGDFLDNYIEAVG